MGDNSLVNFGDLSKPATVLIKKVSDAIGGIFQPFQIKRVAKAEAEAGLIHAEAEIQITQLHRRAMHRFVEEEAKKQANIEDITNNALPMLGENADPSTMEDDWITNFFDKCRIVSDKEMQKLWSGVLAGEARKPGQFSRRTVNILGDLDKSDAELFKNLCGFVWVIGAATPLVFDTQDSMYTSQNITFLNLIHLESLGLVQFNNIGGFQNQKLPKKIVVHYYGVPILLTFPEESDNVLELGHVLLTKAGQELANVCGSESSPTFREFVLSKWSNNSYQPQILPTPEP